MRLRVAVLALAWFCTANAVHATLLRVMTYNIHHALGKDGNLNLSRIASVISAANPDVVSLQEVDNNVPRSNNVLQMQQLGQLTGMQHYFGKARNLDGGGYGNGVLVRNGIGVVSTTNHQLPNPDGVEPRAVVEMNLSVDDNANTTEFKFFATHLMHDSPSGRIDSMHFINGLVSGSTTPAILAGDMNYNPGSPAFNVADNQWDDATNINNSGKNRANQIDYIFYRSNSQWDVTTQSQFIINATTNVASDHHPLLGVLDLDNLWPDNALVWNINTGASTPISDGFATGNGDGQFAFFPASPWDGEYNTGEQNLILGYNANAALTGNASRTIGSMRVGTNAAGAVISGRNGNGAATIANSVNLTIADTANTTGDLTVGEGGYNGTVNWNSSGTLDVQGNVRVGQAGVGTVNQTAGAVTSNGQVSIGANAGGTAVYTVSGGTLATATDGSGAFRIGENGGTGTLRVEGSGAVSHGAEMYIGSGASGMGRVELIGSAGSMQIGQLANANGVSEKITWQASATSVTPINVTGAGPLTSNRVQLQSTTEVAANTGSGSTLAGDGIGLEVNLQAYAGNGPLTLINNQTADAVTGYFENATRAGDLHQQNAPLYGTGYEGAVRVSYTGGTGNDVVLNLTNINADPRLIVRLRGDDVVGADGAAVSSWTDAKSGDTFNGSLLQAASAARPVKRSNAVNGHAAVDFDGVNDVLLSSQTNSLANVNNGVTVFMVAQSDQGSEAGERAAQLGRSDGAPGRVVGMDLSSTSTSVPEGGAGYRWNNGRSTYNAGIDDSDFHIIAFQVDHNSLYAAAKMFVDGTQSTNTFTGNSTHSTATTQLNGSTLELLLGTGRLNGGGLAPNDYYDGQIAEFLVYNDQLSIEDINIIGDALSFKYDLPFVFNFDQAGGAGPVPEPNAVCLTLVAGVSLLIAKSPRRACSCFHHS
jgi:endonuclease/exonuclease/phosphatase family metal-dependent hydrolase